MRDVAFALVLSGLLLGGTAAAAPPSPDMAAVEGPVLSLEEALAAASERNLTLQAQELELERASAQLSQAWGLILPMAQAGGTWSHADHEDTADFTSGLADFFEELGFPVEGDVGGEPIVVRQQDEVSGTLSASVAVVDPQSWATIGVARKGRRLAEASVDEVRQQLLLGVGQAWYGARVSGLLVSLQAEQEAAAELHLDVARRRLEAGAGLRIDVVRAATDLARVRQDRLQATLAWESARDALGVLTGVGGLPVAGEAPVLAVPQGPDEELVARALSAREDIQRARAQVALASASLTQAWMGFLPQLSLAWQGSYRFTEATALGSDDPSRWTAVASLSVPIYAHSRYGLLDERRASLRQARLRLEDLEAQAGQDVRQALRDHHTAQAAVALAREQAELAREGLAITETAYAQGVGSSLEVSDARASEVAAEVNALTSALQAELARLSLLRALGGDMLELVAEAPEPAP